ncbi:MAG: T9SS type A sorting domain-containing protein, partial [Clostridia bacterium]|nr:T9SS type A sorting domain-containing protein [Clostridia bacterium]
NAGVTLDPLTGAVNVAPGTPAGNYELVYEICEILNPTNCDQATVFVPVTAPEILAIDDNGVLINGVLGGVSVANVLANDLLNGALVNPALITLSQISTTNAGVTLDPLTGAVNVASGTPTGTYYIEYEICEILNPGNCDQALVTVPVFQEPTVTFCINDEEALSNGQYAYCSTEPVALTLCGIDTGVAPFDICYEINGTPDCVYDIALDDVIFSQLFAAGVYEVTILSITDAAGYSVVDLSSYHFQFTISTGATAFAGNNAAICQGSAYELSLATAQNASSFAWMGGDGAFTPSANVLNPTYLPGPQDLLDGTVELCLTAQSELPCTLEAVDCMTLTILQPPSVDAGADIVACQSDGFVILNGVVNNAAPTVWSSTGTGGFFAEPADAATIYFFGADDISNGGATLCLTGTAIEPCSGVAIDCLTLTIIADPTANAGPDAVICEGDTYLLAGASVTDAGNIGWETYGDGTFNSITLLNPVYTPGSFDIANGTVQLCLYAEGVQNCGTIADDCMILTIATPPQATLGGDLSLSCADYDYLSGKWLPVALTNTITGDYDSILWTTDGDGTFSDPTAVAPLYNPGLADIWKGDIELCVTVQGVDACQISDTKCMMLYIPQQLIYFDVDGWWGISSYLDTDLPLVKQVMDPLVLIPGSQHLVTMIDKQGKYFWAEPVPVQGTLGNWMPVGYKAKIKNPPACLPIYGDSLLNQTFTVSGAFTFLPVLTNVPVTINQLLAGHLNDILLIYDWSNKVLWTPQAADFTELFPGRAYLMVNRTAIGSYAIQYPDFVPDAPHLFPATPPKSGVIQNSPWQQVRNTAVPHIVLFADKATSKLTNGDILAVFDSQGNCYGQTEYGNTEDVFGLIAMGRNEQLRDERVGFETGEKMFVRKYNAATGEQQEVTFVYDTDFPSSDGLFAANGASRVVDIIETATHVNDLSSIGNVTIYPNPANSELNIKAGSNIQKVELLSSAGQIIMSQSYDATLVRLDVSQYKAGVYIVSITQSTGEVITRRVTIY